MSERVFRIRMQGEVLTKLTLFKSDPSGLLKSKMMRAGGCRAAILQ